MSTQAAADAERDGKPMKFDIVLEYVHRIAITLVLLSLPRLPEIAGRIGLGLMVALFLIQFGRDFLKGVEDAGGWSDRRNPPKPTN